MDTMENPLPIDTAADVIGSDTEKAEMTKNATRVRAIILFIKRFIGFLLNKKFNRLVLSLSRFQIQRSFSIAPFWGMV
jgi:hypothetical protein